MSLKVELHAHTSDDPEDWIPHTTHQLIDRAAALGYHALAITLHDRQLDLEPFRAYAAERGLFLIPGVERTIEGKHVLLINFSPRAEAVRSFEDLAELKRHEPGLVIAPHPFFPLGSCMGSLMDRCAGVVDAVEINGMHVRGADFNRKAVAWARAHGKPLVGNGDVHRLAQLGTTYSLIDADPDPASICDAIRAGRVEVRTEPHTWFRTVVVLTDILAVGGWRALTRRVTFGTIKSR